MLHLPYIREYPRQVQKGILDKGETVDLKPLLKLDMEHRSQLNTLNELRAERNRVSEEIGKSKQTGEDASHSIKSMKNVSSQIKELEHEVGEIADQIRVKLLSIPNLPHSSVPIGKDEKNNVVVREWGNEKEFPFLPKSHLELGTKLGIFDFERGAKLSGSGFPLFVGLGAKLSGHSLILWLTFM